MGRRIEGASFEGTGYILRGGGVVGRSRGGLMRPFRGRAASTRRAFPRRLRDPGLAGRMEGRGPFARKIDRAVVRASAPLRKARGLSLGAAREGGEALWETL